MEDAASSPTGGRRRSPPGAGHESRDRWGTSLYRLNSNQSNTSVFEDVEMAHEEVGNHTRPWAAMADIDD